jgi:hypothetical protein
MPGNKTVGIVTHRLEFLEILSIITEKASVGAQPKKAFNILINADYGSIIKPLRCGEIFKFNACFLSRGITTHQQQNEQTNSRCFEDPTK